MQTNINRLKRINSNKQTQTYRDRLKQRETDSNRERQTQTNRNRHKQTETDTNKQKQTKKYRDRLKETEIDSKRQAQVNIFTQTGSNKQPCCDQRIATHRTSQRIAYASSSISKASAATRPIAF